MRNSSVKRAPARSSKLPSNTTQESHFTAEDFASQIAATWQASVVAILDTGDLLVKAKAKLPHGAFVRMVQSQLPFGERTAQKLMKISGCAHFREHARHLPPSWTILYELTDLSVEAFKAALGKAIRPDMERRMIVQLVKAEAEDTKSADEEESVEPCEQELTPEQRILVALFALHSALQNNPHANPAEVVADHERRAELLRGAVDVHEWLGSFIETLKER